MSRRDGLLLVVVTWLANQGIGFLILGYPRTWDSLAWGVAIGFAALLATEGAGRMELVRTPYAVRLGAALIAGFAVYEGALFVAAAVLRSDNEAFSLATVTALFGTNALALGGLWALHRGAATFGLVAELPVAASAAAAG